MTSERVQRLALLSSPLLNGEDADMYDEILARMCAALKPVDIIDELFIADMVYLEWEIVRLRRLKLSLLAERQNQLLTSFLDRTLDYDLCVAAVERILAKTLEDKLPKAQAEELARQCARSEPDADDKVGELLADDMPDMDDILNRAKADTREELTHAYARREPDAINWINELLAADGLTIDNIRADALMGRIEEMERIERLIALAESRRNLSLRELGRHRAVLGEALRQKMQEVEDAEFELIEPMRKKDKLQRD
jgi:hypothetical protein